MKSTDLLTRACESFFFYHLVIIISFLDVCISCSQEISHSQYTPVPRAPSALATGPLFTIHQSPGSPPTTPSVHSSDSHCSQSLKPDRSSPDTICGHSVAYSPSRSPASSSVPVLSTSSLPMQSMSPLHSTTDTSKPNDDIMQIMHQLIGQEYSTSSTELGASPKHYVMMSAAADNQSANSPYLGDIAVTSPSSDRPQYSPITPSQSPSGN